MKQLPWLFDLTTSQPKYNRWKYFTEVAIIMLFVTSRRLSRNELDDFSNNIMPHNQIMFILAHYYLDSLPARHPDISKCRCVCQGDKTLAWKLLPTHNTFYGILETKKTRTYTSLSNQCFTLQIIFSKKKNLALTFIE